MTKIQYWTLRPRDSGFLNKGQESVYWSQAGGDGCQVTTEGKRVTEKETVEKFDMGKPEELKSSLNLAESEAA